jgi:hypothetical protein
VIRAAAAVEGRATAAWAAGQEGIVNLISEATVASDSISAKVEIGSTRPP